MIVISSDSDGTVESTKNGFSSLGPKPKAKRKRKALVQRRQKNVEEVIASSNLDTESDDGRGDRSLLRKKVGKSKKPPPKKAKRSDPPPSDDGSKDEEEQKRSSRSGRYVSIDAGGDKGKKEKGLTKKLKLDGPPLISSLLRARLRWRSLCVLLIRSRDLHIILTGIEATRAIKDKEKVPPKTEVMWHARTSRLRHASTNHHDHILAVSQLENLGNWAMDSKPADVLKVGTPLSTSASSSRTMIVRVMTAMKLCNTANIMS
jgi:hypothetical protein